MNLAEGLLQAQELVQNLLPYYFNQNPVCLYAISIVQTTKKTRIPRSTIILLFLIQIIVVVNVAHYVATACAFWSSC